MRHGTREEVELIEGKERRRWVQRIPVECWGLQGLRKEDAFFPSRWGHSVPGEGEGEEERRWLYRGRETWNLCPGSRGKWVLEALGVGGRTHDKA